MPMTEMDLTDPMARARVRVAALKARTQKLSLLVVYRAAGESGLIYEQAADVLGWTNTRKCWWKRCGDLREDGYIERHGTPQVRRADSGIDCDVYVITPAGRAVVTAAGL